MNAIILADRYSKTSSLLKKIQAKGRDEQELQFMFPSLYGNKAVTKRTKGIFKEFDNRHYKKCYTKQLMRN